MRLYKINLTVWSVFVVYFFILGCLYSSNIDNISEVNKAKKSALEKISKNKIIINGIVVDESNNPLNQINLKVTKSINLGFLGSKYKTYSKKINSHFELEDGNCNYLYLDFSKPGYYNEHKSLNISQLPGKHNLKVVLLKIGEKAKVKTSTLNLNMSENKYKDVFHILLYKKEKIKAISENIKLPNNIFFLDVDRDKNGRMIKVKRMNRYVASSIKICVKCKDGDGFLLQDGVKDVRILKQAPLSGYTQAPIYFSVYDAVRGNHIVFYYKIENEYGKCVIMSGGTKRDETINVFIGVMSNIEADPNKKRILTGDIL